METEILLLLLVSTAIAHPNSLYISEDIWVRNDDSGYRLPETQVPSGYVISISLSENVFSGVSTEFNGTTVLSFSLTEDTNSIFIHAPGHIAASAISVRQPGSASGVFNVFETFFNESTEILTITLSQNLTAHFSYELTMNYAAQIDTTEMQGFYRSTYLDGNNNREYLVTTQFQPTHARKAFPCFDEPSFKATFQLIIQHPIGTTALFNSESLTNITEGNMTTTTFNASPRMSSYLVAIVVSKFTCSLGDPIAENVPHYVCSTPESENERTLANAFSSSLMQSLENFTNIPYTVAGLNKVHQVAIPDFSAGAMENWGLVTYREMALLFSNTESSNVDRQRILTIIAHEFAHMWFGNLVTCDWWDTLFLNEGFASYFEYFTPANLSLLETAENWEMAKQFIIDQQQNVFVADGFNTSNALTSSATTPSQIMGKFNSISYLKGASVLRMVENIMATENFQLGIQFYLLSRQLATAVPSQLWSALDQFVPDNVLPRNLLLSDIMTNWIDTAGYPLVTVTANGNDVHLTQKRFLYAGSSANEWIVPISYTLSNGTNEFSNVTPKAWVFPGQISILRGLLQNSTWILLNNQESAYYRVNYDDTLWNGIINALSQNHTLIDVLNRAQIVDDALNLARAGEIAYRQTFNIIDYLRYETEYYPWVAALNGVDFLLRVLGETTPAGTTINNFATELMQSVRNSVSFNINASNHIETLKTRLILGRACRLGETACIANVTNLFKGFREGSSVDRNLRSLVYCNGLRYSTNSTDWSYLWEHLQTTRVSSEQVTILSALGCTRDSQNLRNYLEQSINASSIIRRHDISRVWSSVITSNPEGIEAALTFFIENWDRINNYHSGATSLLSTVTARLTTENQLERLRNFSTTTNLTEAIRITATNAVTAVESNMRWASNTRQQLDVHFGKGGASSFNGVSSLVTVLIMVIVILITQ